MKTQVFYYRDNKISFIASICDCGGHIGQVHNGGVFCGYQCNLCQTYYHPILQKRECLKTNDIASPKTYIEHE